MPWHGMAYKVQCTLCKNVLYIQFNNVENPVTLYN